MLAPRGRKALGRGAPQLIDPAHIGKQRQPAFAGRRCFYQMVSQSFVPRTAEINLNRFSAATCAWQKTLCAEWKTVKRRLRRKQQAVFEEAARLARPKWRANRNAATVQCRSRPAGGEAQNAAKLFRRRGFAPSSIALTSARRAARRRGQSSPTLRRGLRGPCGHKRRAGGRWGGADRGRG